jgi:3-phenylpropionate/cinnamic acid dioxygenase small subunit
VSYDSVEDGHSRELVDRLAINDVLVRYAWAIDTKDWNTLDNVFTPDAHIDYTATGGIAGSLAEIKPWLAESLAAFPATQHLLSNSQVTIDGDAATARTAVYNPMGAATRAGPLHFFFMGGIYTDRLMRTAAGWRITDRVEHFVWMDGKLPRELYVPEG